MCMIIKFGITFSSIENRCIQNLCFQDLKHSFKHLNIHVTLLLNIFKSYPDQAMTVPKNNNKNTSEHMFWRLQSIHKWNLNHLRQGHKEIWKTIFYHNNYFFSTEIERYARGTKPCLEKFLHKLNINPQFYDYCG